MDDSYYRSPESETDPFELVILPLIICREETYGSLIFKGGFGNPRATFSYKSDGRFQSSRRRSCTSVNGDNSACVCPLPSTTLTLIVFIASSSNSALGRAVFRPG